LASTTIVGVIDERDRFPAASLFASEGGRSNEFLKVGNEKSSIPELRIIPVLGEAMPAPKLKTLADDF